MKADEKPSTPQGRKTEKKRPKKSARGGGGVLKWVLIICASLLALLFIGLFVATTMVRSWLHGEGFRQRLVSIAETRLKSEVELDDMTWQDSSLYIGALRTRGYRDAAVARIEADGLRAEFDGAANQAWQVPNITLNQLSVEFSDDREPALSEAVLSGDDKAGLRQVPRFLQRWIPQRTEIGQVRIDATNLAVKNGAGEETFALRAVETISRPASASADGWRVQGRGGDLVLPAQPLLGIKSLDFSWRGAEIFLNRSEFTVHDDTQVLADGEMVFGETPEMILRLKVANLDCADVLDETWRDRLSGTLSMEFDVSGDPTVAGGLSQDGSLSLANGVLRDLKVLKRIATYTQSPKFHPLVLHEATMRFERNGDRLVITDLVLESAGLTRLEGSITLQGETIVASNFRVGVTAGTLSFIPGAERKVFTEPDRGFLWTDVVVAGTLSEPSEDLSQRLVTGAIESVVEDAPAKVIETATDAVTDPAGAAGDLLEQGTEALRALTPFFK